MTKFTTRFGGAPPTRLAASPPKGGEDRRTQHAPRADRTYAQDDLKAAAAQLARFGLAVFPGGANPTRPLTPRGHLDATRSIEEIEQLWSRFPNANAWVATGTPSGVFVLDIDVKGADGHQSLRSLEDRFGPLPRTWRSETPSGGAHMWFRHTAEHTFTNRVGFQPGLDIRTTGGAVVAPPSRRHDGVYSWSARPGEATLAEPPAWLVELLEDRHGARPVAFRRAHRFPGPAAAARYVAQTIDRECRAVAQTPPNSGRNNRLFQAAARLGEFVGTGVVTAEIIEKALTQAATECGLLDEDGPRSVRATIRSGLRHGAEDPRSMSF